MRERAPLQLRFVGIEVRVLRPVRVCLDAVASRLGVERQSGKVCSQKNVSPSALKLLARKGLQSLLQRRLYASCDQYRRLRASSRELGRNAARRIEPHQTHGATRVHAKHLATEEEKLPKTATGTVASSSLKSGPVAPRRAASSCAFLLVRFLTAAPSPRGCARTGLAGSLPNSHHFDTAGESN